VYEIVAGRVWRAVLGTACHWPYAERRTGDPTRWYRPWPACAATVCPSCGPSVVSRSRSAGRAGSDAPDRAVSGHASTGPAAGQV